MVQDRSELERVADFVTAAWRPEFPDAAMVGVAAALLPGIRCPVGDLQEGPHWRITVGPGVVAVGTRDYNRSERSDGRATHRHLMDSDAAVAWFEETGEWPPDPDPRSEITEWSRKSRARMVRRLCELDYLPLYVDGDGARHGRLPAMVTLTLPGDWLTVAPDGASFKALLKMFRKRYERAWGEPLACIWKLEFQRRGAPHLHMLMTPPHGTDQATGRSFRDWLSWTWADVVDHPDPEERARHERAGTGIDFAEGLRARDPRRVAVYFLKHNTAGPDDKEYQHRVPEEWREPGKGPGRFWGYWTLKPRTTTVEVEPRDAIAAARVMRRWSRAQRRVQSRPRARYRGGRVAPVDGGPVVGLAGAQLVEGHRRRMRRSRSRVVLVGRGRGWIAVPDGPSFTADLARYLAQLDPQKTRERQRSVVTRGQNGEWWS